MDLEEWQLKRLSQLERSKEFIYWYCTMIESKGPSKPFSLTESYFTRVQFCRVDCEMWESWECRLRNRNQVLINCWTVLSCTYYVQNQSNHRTLTSTVPVCYVFYKWNQNINNQTHLCIYSIWTLLNSLSKSLQVCWCFIQSSDITRRVLYRHVL